MRKIISLFVVLCTLVSMVSIMPMTASAAEWYDNFSGDETNVTKENGVITFDVKEAGQLVDSKKGLTLKNGLFDIEWTMATSSGAGFVIIICTGTRRMYMDCASGVLSYMPDGFSTHGQLSSFNYTIPDTEFHTYRMITSDTKRGALYVDGEYISDFTMDARDEAAHFRYVTSQVGEVKMKDFVLRDVAQMQQSTEVKEVEYMDPERDFFLDFTDEEVAKLRENPNWVQDHECITMEDGLLKFRNPGGKTTYIAHRIGIGKDFVFTTRVYFHAIGESGVIVVKWPNKQIRLNLGTEKITCGGVTSDLVDLMGKWSEIKVEGKNDGENVLISIDGKPLLYCEAQDEPGNIPQYQMQFTHHLQNGIGYKLDVDWVRCQSTRNDSEVSIGMPFQNAEYLENSEIRFKANVAEDADVSEVRFKVNGNVVATGQKPEYIAAVAGLEPGRYDITAEYDGGTTAPVSINVVPGVKGEIVTEQSGKDTTIKLNFAERYSDVAKVEYLVDGVLIAESSNAPEFAAKLSDLTPAGHSLTAIFRNKNGQKISSLVKKITTLDDTQNTSMNYSNEIEYTVSGNKGNAVYELNNGMHQVKLTHTPDKVTYLTDAGEESHPIGEGVYKIITEGATADVYWNGRLAFSYYLPLTEQVGTKCSENGMKVIDASVSIPQNRYNYFVKRNVTDKKSHYDLDNVPYIHNMDFVANEKDNARIVLKDGYFRTDVELKNGKIYIRKIDFNSSTAYRKEVADMQKGEVYYRVESVAGMCRLYANGRWITTFKSPHVAGGKSLDVDVSGGDGLKYLAVSDNTDLYLYADKFDGSGELDWEDYWLQNNIGVYPAAEGGVTMSAFGEDGGIAEMSAYVGEVELEADVNVQHAQDGFYFLFGHFVSNCYSKIGYNFKTGKYELVHRRDDEVETETAIDGTFPVNEPVHLSMKVEGMTQDQTVTLTVNGEVVLSQKTVQSFRGKCGFMLSNAVVNLQNISFRGDAKLNETMKSYLLPQIASEVIETEGQPIILGDDNKRYRLSEDASSATREDSRFGDAPNMTNLYDENGMPTGEIVSAKVVPYTENGQSVKRTHCWYSPDWGETWEDLGPMQPSGLTIRGSTNNRIVQGYSGRLYYSGETPSLSEEAGCTEVWVSEDKGRTWWESNQKLDALQQGHTIAESTIVEMPDGVVRCYTRTNLGNVVYYESYDHGHNWDLSEPHMTPFISAVNCFGIQADMRNPGHMYAAWGYDNTTQIDSFHNPRTRYGVARSTDSGKTWEYLGTVHEDISHYNTHMNLAIHVTEDYVIVIGWGSDIFSNTKYGDVGGGMVTRILEKSKLKPVKDFEQVHMLDATRIENTKLISDQMWNASMLFDISSGNALVHRKYIEKALIDDMVSMECIAAYFGAAVNVDEDGVPNISIGNQFISFEKEALSQKDGIWYVKQDAFVEKFGMLVTEYNDTKIIDRVGVWAPSQNEIFSSTVNAFIE